MKNKKKTWDFENCFGHLTKIEWIDSASNHGWEACHGDESPTKMKTVGFLVSSAKSCVTVSTTISERVNFLDKLTIPRENIRKMTVFGVVAEKRRKRG